MKIVAGLGSLDEYVRFCDAGADEFFAGYVPYDWNRKYGTMLPLNRREVLCCNVQLGSFSELEILAAMVRKYQKPVHLTFNALYYIPEQYPGTGDIFTSVMTGALLQGEPLAVAVDRATQFVAKAIRFTYAYNTTPREGVLLEKVLPTVNDPLGSINYKII